MRDAEWRLIIIVVIVLDICLLAFLTPECLKSLNKVNEARIQFMKDVLIKIVLIYAL